MRVMDQMDSLQPPYLSEPDPYDIAFNPDNGDLYVVNQGDNTVSVIGPLTTTFSEGCNGTIGSGGQAATCTVTNAYGRPA